MQHPRTYYTYVGQEKTRVTVKDGRETGDDAGISQDRLKNRFQNRREKVYKMYDLVT